MPYSTPDDLTNLLSEQLLLQLAADDPSAPLDNETVQGVVAEAIEQADREIDAYAGVKHAVPFVETPPLIANISAKIAAHNLSKRRPHLELTEWSKEYARCLKLLEKIASGALPLTPKTDPGEQVAAQDGGGSLIVNAPERKFSASVWEKY